MHLICPSLSYQCAEHLRRALEEAQIRIVHTELPALPQLPGAGLSPGLNQSA